MIEKIREEHDYETTGRNLLTIHFSVFEEKKRNDLTQWYNVVRTSTTSVCLLGRSTRQKIITYILLLQTFPLFRTNYIRIFRYEYFRTNNTKQVNTLILALKSESLEPLNLLVVEYLYIWKKNIFFFIVHLPAHFLSCHLLYHNIVLN